MTTVQKQHCKADQKFILKYIISGRFYKENLRKIEKPIEFFRRIEDQRIKHDKRQLKIRSKDGKSFQWIPVDSLFMKNDETSMD